MGGFIMERNPLIEYNDGLVLTYSDLKDENGIKYIVVYLEKPNAEKTNFDSAEFTCPGEGFRHVVGFSEEYLRKNADKFRKMGNHALSWAKEDAYATASGNCFR